jgi:hypothetical protein
MHYENVAIWQNSLIIGKFLLKYFRPTLLGFHGLRVKSWVQFYSGV